MRHKMNATQIDCQQALQQVYDLIDNALEEENRASMHRHLQICRSCYSRVEFERLLKKRISDLANGDASNQIVQRVTTLLNHY